MSEKKNSRQQTNVRRADNRKVVKYRRRRQINVGMIVFAAVLIYISVYMIVYLTREKVTIYEVVSGKNAAITNKSYTGLILRDEYVINADASGYLNYFVKEGSRVSVSSTVYTIDESGAVSSFLADASANGDIAFSAENESELRKLISNFTYSQSDLSFDNIYDFKLDMEAKVLECINLNNIKQLYDANNLSQGTFNIHTAEKTGIVEYYTDGYEGKTEATLTSADFNIEKYEKKSHISGELIENATPAYKIINTENWSVYIKLSDEEREKYADTTVMRVKFLKDNREVTGNFAICYIDGQAYGRIDLVRYMSTYADERFVELQIVEEQVEGLKIPKSSVVEKDFYLIPSSYAYKGGASTDTGFYKKTFDDAGNESVEFITPTIYKVTDEYYYVDAGDEKLIKEGDYLVMEGSTENFRVSQKASLKGAYNVNNGYCVFRNVEILTETGDYYLVDTGTTYGLKVYDHIVIDGSMVSEKQVVFTIN